MALKVPTSLGNIILTETNFRYDEFDENGFTITFEADRITSLGTDVLMLNPRNEVVDYSSPLGLRIGTQYRENSINITSQTAILPYGVEYSKINDPEYSNTPFMYNAFPSRNGDFMLNIGGTVSQTICRYAYGFTPLQGQYNLYMTFVNNPITGNRELFMISYRPSTSIWTAIGQPRTQREFFYNYINTHFVNRPIPPTPGGDDYQGDTNQTGGGNGDRDNTGDTIGIPGTTGLETASILGTQLLTTYCPTFIQVKNIAQFIWGADFVKNLAQVFPGNTPMDYILSLKILPVGLPESYWTTGKFYFGSAGFFQDVLDPPECRVLLHQYYDVDLGSVEVKEYYGGFADYSPYTKYTIFLPYLGFKDLDTDAIMGKTLSVKYRIDLVSGACVAYILANDTVVTTFSGNCSTDLPISGQNYNALYQGVATAVAGVASAGITYSGAGAAAAIASGGVGAGLVPVLDNERNKLLQTSIQQDQSRLSAIGSTIGIMGNKPTVFQDGNLGPSMGLVNQQAVYLIRKLPNQAFPADLKTTAGYVSNTSQPIGNYSGFAVFSDFHLENLVQGEGQIGATQTELSMIASALQGGIII